MDTNDPIGVGFANVCYVTASTVAQNSLTECAVAQLQLDEVSEYEVLSSAGSYAAFVNSQKIFIRATTPATVGTPVAPAACIASIHCATAESATNTC